MGPLIDERVVRAMMAALEAVKEHGREVVPEAERLDRPGPNVPVALSIGAGFGLGPVAAAASWYLLERPLARVSRRGWGRAPRRAA